MSRHHLEGIPKLKEGSSSSNVSLPFLIFFQAHKKTKPRQSAPAATIQPRLSSSSSSSGLPRSTTSKAVNRELDDHEEEEPAFSDFNPFQSPSGNESTGQGMAASKGKKTRRKVGTS